jgi:hypothetical protein
MPCFWSSHHDAEGTTALHDVLRLCAGRRRVLWCQCTQRQQQAAAQGGGAQRAPPPPRWRVEQEKRGCFANATRCQTSTHPSCAFLPTPPLTASHVACPPSAQRARSGRAWRSSRWARARLQHRGGARAAPLLRRQRRRRRPRRRGRAVRRPLAARSFAARVHRRRCRSQDSSWRRAHAARTRFCGIRRPQPHTAAGCCRAAAAPVTCRCDTRLRTRARTPAARRRQCASLHVFVCC